jgi:TPR repeat protein
MTERAKSSGPESSGRTEPVTTFFDTSTRSTSGDQFHLLSEPKNDQPSDLISSRGPDLALSEAETVIALFSESDGHKNTDERWESDRRQLEKWSIAAKMTMIALVAIVIAIATAVPLLFFQDNEPLADATRQQVAVPKQTATQTAPAAAAQSGETLLTSAEQDRPRDPTSGLNSVLTPGDTAADSKSIDRDQNPPPQALAATSPGRLIDKEELAKGLTPDDTAADIKTPAQGQNPPLQAPAATSPGRLIDKEELAKGLTPDDTAADIKTPAQGQNPPLQAPAATSPGGLIDKEELAKGPTPEDTAAGTKSIGQGQNPPPQASAATQSPARVMDKEELANLLKRGRYLLSIGDIAPARLLLERAADALDASAAFDLAGTYDPAVLTRSHLSGIVPDLAMARMWYEKALSLGHSEAQQRLAQLQK